MAASNGLQNNWIEIVLRHRNNTYSGIIECCFMPPMGCPYKYNRRKVRRVVPQQRGVYWLWSFGELVRIGQSTNLQRRLLEYSPKEPNKFQYDTIDQYFQKRDAIQKPPPYDINNGGTILDKIEHTEFTWFEQKHERLPRWNKQHKHYDVGVFEDLLSRFDDLF